MCPDERLTFQAGLWIRIPDPDPGARKLRNFSGKMHFLVFKKKITTKTV
jgi:hypothetical protein